MLMPLIRKEDVAYLTTKGNREFLVEDPVFDSALNPQAMIKSQTGTLFPWSEMKMVKHKYNDTVTLRCGCCGHHKTFPNLEQAFRDGWDAPPHFTGYVSCNLCPAVCQLLNLPHAKAHEHWAQYGRPPDFDSTCVADGYPMPPDLEPKSSPPPPPPE